MLHALAGTSAKALISEWAPQFQPRKAGKPAIRADELTIVFNGQRGEIRVGRYASGISSPTALVSWHSRAKSSQWFGPAFKGPDAGAARIVSTKLNAIGKGVGVLKMRRLVTMRRKLARVG